LGKIKTYYGSHVFSRAVLSQVYGYYGAYFLTSTKFGLALAAVSIVAIVWSLQGPKRALFQPVEHKAVDLADVTLLVSLNLLPLILFVLMRITHGALLERYTLATAIGVAFGIASAAYIAGPKGIVLLALFFFPKLGAQEMNFWGHRGLEAIHEFSVQSPAEFGQIQDFVQSAGYPDLPVVVTQGMVYLQIVHYSPPIWTKRLIYLTDPDKELAFEGADTVVKTMLGLRDFYPVQLASYGQFTKTQREFLVYSDGPGWILDSLIREAASVRLLKLDKGRSVFLIQMRRSSE
jgi:hypothetical protein